MTDALGPNLNVWKHQLGYVPDAVWSRTELETVVLADNTLAELSERIGSLTHLRMFGLRADGNQLTSLPEWIGEPRALPELHLRNHRLTTLPASIGRLRDLRQLDLRSNPLRKLPPAIVALPKLDKLDLRWVTTLALPAWFNELEARGCLIYRYSRATWAKRSHRIRRRRPQARPRRPRRPRQALAVPLAQGPWRTRRGHALPPHDRLEPGVSLPA